MSVRSLFEPILEPGRQTPNFFEGRLLTAEALREDQRANRTLQRSLGRAVGTGVVRGLFVTAQGGSSLRRTLGIQAGTAVTGDGDVLELREDIAVDIVPPTTAPQPAATLFNRCSDAEPVVPELPIGTGLYVVVMSAATGYRDRAPQSGLGIEGKVIGCGARYVVEGVRFRLEGLSLDQIAGRDSELRGSLQSLLSATTGASLSMLRNLVAHACFGTQQALELLEDPLALSNDSSPFSSHGPLDALRSLGRLCDCDVPLALLLWNARGIAFVDCWSARRSPTPPAASEKWPSLAPRARREGEARFFQFQDQLTEIVTDDALGFRLHAKEYWRYLPAAGLLPIAETGRRGVSKEQFFEGFTLRSARAVRAARDAGPMFLEGARVHALLEASLEFPAIDTLGEELVWTYRVRENAFRREHGSSSKPSELVVFASGQLPYVATPHFDVARWDYSNYSSERFGPGSF